MGEHLANKVDISPRPVVSDAVRIFLCDGSVVVDSMLIVASIVCVNFVFGPRFVM